MKSRVFLLIMCVLFVNVSPSHAATIIVETAVDELDGLTGNGDCSLREAIMNANQNNGNQVDCIAGSGADVITFDSALDGTVILLSIAGTGENGNAAGDLDILGDLTINGNGAKNTVIDAGNIDRVLHVYGTFMVEINGVTIQNGETTTAGELGGGVYNQGGILTIQQSHITNNHAQIDIGGGIVNEDGFLTIINSTIYNNTTGNSGGGVLNLNSSSTVTTITTDIINTTISGNQAVGYGAGVANASDTTGNATVTFTNSTVIANMAGEGGGIYNSGFSTGVATTYLQNTIMAGNGSASDGTWDCFAEGTGNIISDGHNLVRADQGCPSNGSGDQITNLPTDDVHLALADNGGTVLTHALPPSSSAIDTGDNAACAASPVNNLDQRSAIRPVDYDNNGTATCDIGAYERQLSDAEVVEIVVETAVDELNGVSGNGSCSLREAITNANENSQSQVDCVAGSGSDGITFAPDLNGTAVILSLVGTTEDANTTGDLDITDHLIISGNGVGDTIIDANNIDRILHIFEQIIVVVNNVTVQNGQTINNGEPGGGIYNHGGTLVIDQSHITNNHAQGDLGGGIMNTDGYLTILNSTIYNNTTGASGGGVLNLKESPTTATITADIINTTISDNQADGVGAGIANGNDTDGDAIVMLTNSTVTANMADEGGGIYNSGVGTGAATTYLQNSIVAGNGGAVDFTWDCSSTGMGNTNSNGHNLVGMGQGCPTNGSGDQTTNTPNDDVNPILADNGGETLTHALTHSSLAIDAGDNTACAAYPINNLDQRGKTRPVDYDDDSTATCDVGAFERQAYEDEIVTLPLIEGATETFGTTAVTITDNAVENPPGLTTIIRTNQPPGSQDTGEMPFQFSINAATDTGLNVNLTICYTDAEIAAGSVIEANLQLYRYDDVSGGWVAMGVTNLDVGNNNCATLDGVSAFSSWTLASAEPTAVSIQSITTTNSWYGLSATIILGLLFVVTTAVYFSRKRRPSNH